MSYVEERARVGWKIGNAAAARATLRLQQRVMCSGQRSEVNVAPAEQMVVKLALEFSAKSSKWNSWCVFMCVGPGGHYWSC